MFSNLFGGIFDSSTVTPTAIPSGILCNVTARTSMVVFFR